MNFGSQLSNFIFNLISGRRRRMFATNRFVTSACSGQFVTSRLRSITSWHMFVTVNVSFNTHACDEVHFVAKFMQSRTCPEVKSSRSYFSPCKPSNYSPTTDASWTVPYTGTDVPYSRTESTTDAPTDSWEPLPFCPEWSEYKFDGQVDAIDWQCPTYSAHQFCILLAIYTAPRMLFMIAICTVVIYLIL